MLPYAVFVFMRVEHVPVALRAQDPPSIFLQKEREACYVFLQVAALAYQTKVLAKSSALPWESMAHGCDAASRYESVRHSLTTS